MARARIRRSPKGRSIMLTRRQALASGIAAGSAILATSIWSRSPRAAAAVPGGTLDPTTVAKFVTPLFILPAMPPAGTIGGTTDYYTIGARQFRQQILPSGQPPTLVFGYGSTTDPSTFHYPSYTLEAR